MKITIVSYLLLFITFILVLGVFNLQRLWSLSERSAVADGTIVNLTPKDHDRFSYSFQVNDKNYQGSGYIGRRELDFPQISGQ